jgi:hypothetical protein
MFVSIGIHRPFPEPDKQMSLAQCMKTFGLAMRQCKGFRQSFVLKEPDEGLMIGLAIWDTREDFVAARPLFSEAIKGFDFSEVEGEDPLVYWTDVIQTQGNVFDEIDLP